MTEEEIERQAEEFADEILEFKPKNILSRRDMLEMDFKAGAKWGMETICTKILQEVERKSIESSYPFSVSNLVEIIKELTGVDL